MKMKHWFGIVILTLCGIVFGGFYTAEIPCDICAYTGTYQYYTNFGDAGFPVYTYNEPCAKGHPELRFFRSEIRVCKGCKTRYQQRYQESMSFAHNKMLRLARKEQAAAREKNVEGKMQMEINEIEAKIAELKLLLAEKIKQREVE